MGRVLLVDDDAGVLAICGTVLRHAGLDVETAACGRAALDAIDCQPCDLLLLDLNLPDFNGLDVLAAARRRGLTAPVVLLTGYASLDTSIAAMRLGAVDYLTKPVLDDDLLEAVERALGRKPVTSGAESEAPPADGLALWVTAMCRVIDAPLDVPSVGRWAVRLGIARETLHGWCRTAGLPAKASLDLARVLRAVRCAWRHGGEPARFLAMSDRHAVKRLLMDGGVGVRALPPFEEVLSRRTLVRDSQAVAVLRNRLRGPRSASLS